MARQEASEEAVSEAETQRRTVADEEWKPRAKILVASMLGVGSLLGGPVGMAGWRPSESKSSLDQSEEMHWNVKATENVEVVSDSGSGWVSSA